MRSEVINIFEPDTILPVQFRSRFAGRAIMSGEHQLMLAVLTDAVECCQRFALAKSHAAQRQYEEAREWIASTDLEWPFSFENICNELGFDPGALRDALLADSNARGPQRPRIKPRVVALSRKSPRVSAPETGAAA
jgi:hypothetical protein